MNKTEFSRESEIGSYLEAFLYRASKKSHNASLQKFIPRFENGQETERLKQL